MMLTHLILAVAFAAEASCKTEVPLKFYPAYIDVRDATPGATTALKPESFRGKVRFWMFVETPRAFTFRLRFTAEKGGKVDGRVARPDFRFVQTHAFERRVVSGKAEADGTFAYTFDSSRTAGFYVAAFDLSDSMTVVPVSADIPFAVETDDGLKTLSEGRELIVSRRPLDELDALGAKVKFDRPVNILFLGDSLTDYERGSNHVDTVCEYLNKRHPGQARCFNYAKGGDCIKYVISRMDGKGKGDWLARYDGLWDRSYDIAFVLLGHNDTKADYRSDYKIPYVPRDRMVSDYVDLIGRLRKHGVGRIVLVSSTSSDLAVCTHVHELHLPKAKAAGKSLAKFGIPAQLEAYNAALREIAAKEGVEYLDVYEKMKARPDKAFMVRFTDGVHLTKRGNDYLALELLRFLGKD